MMQWLQEYGSSFLMVLMVLVFMYRGQLLAKMAGVKEISVHDLAARLASQNPPLLVDVRTQEEFNQISIRQAVLTPLSEIRQRAKDLYSHYQGREVVVICRSGNRSLFGAVSLKRAGFAAVSSVAGGILDWQGQGYPVRQ